MDTDELWNNIFLKKCKADDFSNVLTISDMSSKRKYQIFEVLVTETLARLYKDFQWKTSPIQHDGGVDFIAEKKVSDVDKPNYFPQLLIYGQIKRRNTSISEKLILDATSNIIRYYRTNALQEKCLYEIIHVFSTDKKITDGIKKTIENIDNLHYCVRIIDAEYLFNIWCLNRNFIHSIIDSALSVKEVELLDDYIKNNKLSWDKILNIQSTVEHNISVGQTFECLIEISSTLDIAFSVRVQWLPTDKKHILLVSPQSLLSNDPLIVKSINNKIFFEIKFLADSAGKQDLGSLLFISPFNQNISQISLGQVTIDKRFNPSFCEIPVASVMKKFRKALIENENKPSFYVITGEGGIGKSKLLENILIFAVNHKYKCVTIEHTCNWEDDRNILFQILGFLCECKNYNNVNELYPCIRRFLGGLYKLEWDEDLRKFLNGEVVKNDDIIIECIFNILLYTLENDCLCIAFSNMHWASPFLLSTLKFLIEYINDNKLYLRNNITIIFEGRSEEKIHANYRNLTPYDWIEFCNYNILKKIRLQKWEQKASKIYINSLFKQPKTLMESSDLENIENLLLEYSSGNPMHVNEMIKHLLTERTLTIDDNGKLQILVTDVANKFSTEILDVILLRIQYFVDKQPEFMDYLIILANLMQDDYETYSKYINNIFIEMNIDGIAFFVDTGFIIQRNNIYFFTHEHYKTLLMQQKICNYTTVEKFLCYSVDGKRSLSGVSKIRLMMLKDIKTNLYMETVFDETIHCLKKSKNSFEQYSLLQMLEDFPTDILQMKGYPLYKLYRFLIDGAMVIANYSQAKKYIEKISNLVEYDEEYYLNLIYAKKMLCNIEGLQMEMDNAIHVGLNFIAILENYLDSYNVVTENIQKEHILLYDRVAIEYYMAGQYQQSKEYHEIATTMLEQFNDPYVKYHLLYEQGIRELHNDIGKGIGYIEDSLRNLPTYDFMTEGQEKDLILGDLLMANLLKPNTEDQLNDIKKMALGKCNELATFIEPFESILFHWVVGVCFILQKNYKEAIRYFKISVIIAAKTPIVGMLWKSYINLAQAYFLFGRYIDKKHEECYDETAKYYILEAKEIIEDAIQCNVWTKNDFEKRLSYPISLIDWMLGSIKQKDTQFKKFSPLHVDFDNYSFFMLD